MTNDKSQAREWTVTIARIKSRIESFERQGMFANAHTFFLPDLKTMIEAQDALAKELQEMRAELAQRATPMGLFSEIDKLKADRDALTAEVGRLAKQAQGLREALEFYADKSNWKNCPLPGSELGKQFMLNDHGDIFYEDWGPKQISGKRARAALKREENND